MSTQACPLCSTNAVFARRPRYDQDCISCPCCGAFVVCGTDDIISEIPKPYHRLSHFLRRRYETTRRPYEFDDRGPSGRFPDDLSELPVVEKLNLTLLTVADRTEAFGKPANLDQRTDWPLVQAHDADEFATMLQHWEAIDALTTEPEIRSALDYSYTLTGLGWKNVEALRPSRPGSGKQAFVAMAFQPELDHLYDEAIVPGLAEVGWTAWRADREKYEEKICDRIVSEIRRSSLLVVECTEQRPNVFFEAGLAMGLGIPIIWCIRKADLTNNRLAFDTRQYAHLPWETSADLRQKLVDRMRALYVPAK